MDLIVNIDVDDLSKAIAFYQAAVGLRVARRFGSFDVEMLGTSSPIYLLVKAAGTKPSINTDEARRHQRHCMPVHLDFVIAVAKEFDQTNSVAEGIGHVGYATPIVRLDFALDCGSGFKCPADRSLNLRDDEINMHWCPVSLIATYLVSVC